MKTLILTALAAVYLAISVPTAVAQSGSYSIEDVGRFEEFDRLYSQAGKRISDDMEAYFEKVGHILGRQAAILGEDENRQARFRAMVAYFENMTFMMTVYMNGEFDLYSAFRKGLLGLSERYDELSVYSIYTDQKVLIAEVGAQATPAAPASPPPPEKPHPLAGSYERHDDCPYSNFRMSHFATVGETGVQVVVENYGCVEKLNVEATLSGGQFNDFSGQTDHFSLAANARQNPGTISGIAENFATGQRWELSGIEWFFDTTDMRGFHLVWHSDHFPGDVRFDR